MIHVHLNSEKLRRTEQSLVDALQHVDGIVVTGATVATKRKAREVDALVITAQGVWCVEGKGTRLSGQVEVHAQQPWTVGGRQADFAGGPNPLKQARSAAQVLAALLSQASLQVGFVTPVVVVCGDVSVSTQRQGDVVCTDLESFADLFNSSQPARVSQDDVASILTQLDADVTFTDEDLSSFPHVKDDTSRKDRSRERFLEASARAHNQWSKSNSRRVWFSAAGGAAGVLFVSLSSDPFALTAGAIGYLAGVLVTLWLRWRRPGLRKSSPVHMLGWLVSLLPYFGATALAVSGWISSDATGVAETLYLQLTMLLAMGVLATTFAGRSWFVYPPPEVVQQVNKHGTPTGVFFFVEPPAGWRRPPGTGQSQQPDDLGPDDRWEHPLPGGTVGD